MYQTRNYWHNNIFSNFVFVCREDEDNRVRRDSGNAPYGFGTTVTLADDHHTFALVHWSGQPKQVGTTAHVTHVLVNAFELFCPWPGVKRFSQLKQCKFMWMYTNSYFLLFMCYILFREYLYSPEKETVIMSTLQRVTSGCKYMYIIINVCTYLHSLCLEL